MIALPVAIVVVHMWDAWLGLLVAVWLVTPLGLVVVLGRLVWMWLLVGVVDDLVASPVVALLGLLVAVWLVCRCRLGC